MWAPQICSLVDLPDSISASLAAREEARAAAARLASSSLGRVAASSLRLPSLSAAAAAGAALGGGAALQLQLAGGHAALRAWLLRLLMALLMSGLAYVLIFAQQLLVGPSARLLRAFVDR